MTAEERERGCRTGFEIPTQDRPSPCMGPTPIMGLCRRQAHHPPQWTQARGQLAAEDRAHTDSCVPAHPPSASQLMPDVCSHATNHPLCAGASLPAKVESPGYTVGRPCVRAGVVYLGAPTPDPASSIKGTPRIIPASKSRHESRSFLKPWRWASPLCMLAVGPQNWKWLVSTGPRRPRGRRDWGRRGAGGRGRHRLCPRAMLTGEGIPGRGPQQQQSLGSSR